MTLRVGFCQFTHYPTKTSSSKERFFSQTGSRDLEVWNVNGHTVIEFSGNGLFQHCEDKAAIFTDHNSTCTQSFEERWLLTSTINGAPGFSPRFLPEQETLGSTDAPCTIRASHIHNHVQAQPRPGWLFGFTINQCKVYAFRFICGRK